MAKCSKVYIQSVTITRTMYKHIVTIALGLCIFMVPAATAQTDGGIHVEEVGELTYHFSLPYLDNITESYWVFGDGASSDQPEPVHAYTERGSYTVRVEVKTDNMSYTYTYPLDNRELLNTENGTLNVDGFSVPGTFLLVSCSIMYLLARTGNHPLTRAMGKGGRYVVCFLYGMGVVAGAYLVIASLYGGVQP